MSKADTEIPGSEAKPSRDPRLVDAARRLEAGDVAAAELLLRDYLVARPTDAAALAMLADVAQQHGDLIDAEQMLRRAIDLEPTFTPARAGLAKVLFEQQRPAEARRELNRVAMIGEAPGGDEGVRAEAAGRRGVHEEAIDLFRRVLEMHPQDLSAWLSVGHHYRALGKSEDAIASYRRACELAPQFGEAWWSLANLKTFHFSEADIKAMRSSLSNPKLRPEDRISLNFALGKALEDEEDWSASFMHYTAGNRERRAGLRYRASDYHALVDRSIATFAPGFFAERKGFGADAADPIFIVGLPRSGSTLIEHILASHPLVEGTAEHHEIPLLAKRLSCPDGQNETHPYPELLADIDGDTCRALGEEYLERMAGLRVTDRPFFIDKLPNNWIHVGFIRLILPNARIIDARRHPLACGLSNFKQHFARGQNFSYDLGEIGHFYAQYARLMRHMDAVLPSPPVRIINEDLVANPEGEIRELLASLNLPWDDTCLHHQDNSRAVNTPSAEQVRKPINADGVDHWRHYDSWLGPMRAALGPVLDDWKR